MLLKMVVQSALGILVLGLLLFASAGMLAWPQAWAFLGLFGLGSLVTGLWLLRVDPGLLDERMKSPLNADQQPRDRGIMALMLLGFAAWLAAMGLDHRFGWSHVHPSAQVLGGALIVATFLGFAWVMQANSFASVTVRVQHERGQSVVSTGPYAVVRHPMYAFVLLLVVGSPLLLGSLWGLAGVVLFIPLLAARALGEEAILVAGLPGYRDYAATVRFRLVPRIW